MNILTKTCGNPCNSPSCSWLNPFMAGHGWCGMSMDKVGGRIFSIVGGGKAARKSLLFPGSWPEYVLNLRFYFVGVQIWINTYISDIYLFIYFYTQRNVMLTLLRRFVWCRVLLTVNGFLKPVFSCILPQRKIMEQESPRSKKFCWST